MNLNKREIEDISIKQVNQISNKNNIVVKSLPRINAKLRKNEIKPYVEEKPFIKVWYYFKIKNTLFNFFISSVDKYENNTAHR